MWLNDRDRNDAILDLRRHRPRGGSGTHLRVRMRADARKAVYARRMAISLLMVTVAALGALTWYGVRHAGRVLFHGSSRYAIRTLEIRNGGSTVRDFIRGRHGIQEGTNLFAFNIGAIQRDFLKTAPSFKSMKITRVLPDTLCVEVVERTPLARVGRYGSLATDSEGAVFGLRGLPDNMTRITGYAGPDSRPGDALGGVMLDAVRLLDLCDKTPIGQDLVIREVDVRGGFGGRDDSLRIELDGGTTVDFWWQRAADEAAALADLRERLRFLAGVIRRSRQEGRPLRTVNLTLDNYKGNCPVTPRWN